NGKFVCCSPRQFVTSCGCTDFNTVLLCIYCKINRLLSQSTQSFHCISGIHTNPYIFGRLNVQCFLHECFKVSGGNRKFSSAKVKIKVSYCRNNRLGKDCPAYCLQLV